MSRPTPRRPSRTTTPRPRRLAGQATPASVPASVDPPSAGDAGTPPPAGPPTARDRTDPGPEPEGAPPALASRRVTRALTVTLGVLVVLLLLQGVWFAVHANRNDDSAVAVDDSGADTPISVPEGRPVVLDQLAVQEGVDAAAHAAEAMFARNHEGYDEGVEQATKLMTDEFAEEFRRTTGDVKQEFVAKETVVEVRVVAQGVVRANEAELEALIFLNQYVFRGKGGDATTAVTPYRALLTMVHTDRGWFVDDVATK